MHVVLGDIVYANGLEGASTNVQGQPGEFRALVFELLQKGIVEVQAGGWCGYGACMAGKDRLVAGFIIDFCCMGNVRR